MLKRTLLALGLLSVFGQANAALIEADWKNKGDNLAFYDTENDITYLDLSQTLNLSIDDVTSALSTSFSGWRLPTESELDTLFSSLIGNASGQKTIDSTDGGPKTTYTEVDESLVQNLASISGGFTEENTDYFDDGSFVETLKTYGFFTNDLGHTAFYGTWLSYWNDGSENYTTMKFDLGSSNPNLKTGFHGVYLVQNGQLELNDSSGSIGGGGSSGGSGGSGGNGGSNIGPDGEVSNVPMTAYGLSLLSFGLIARRKKQK